MKKIANIITNEIEQVKYDLKYSEDIYNILNFSETFDKSLPTLFIGYTFIDKNVYKINILEKKYSKTLWWTFSKEEKLIDYFEILREFEENVLSFYSNLYDYKSFNFLLYPHKTFKDLFILFQDDQKTIKKIYLNKRSVYVLFKNNQILGFDLNYFWYIDKSKTFKLLKMILAHKLVINDKTNEILNSYKQILHYQTELSERYIVAFET